MTLIGGEFKITHSVVDGGERGAAAVQDSLGVCSKAILTGHLESHTAGFAHYDMSAFRMEGGVYLPQIGSLGAAGLNTCVANGDGRTLVIIIALLLGLVIYGKYT